MEVHAPEHVIHSRREFLVHMVAITLGLLIAVGIDQSVEYLHHRHQRHELEENMRDEAGRNVEILSTHFEVNIPNLLWYRSVLKAAQATKPDGGYYDITLPPPAHDSSNKIMTSPERAVFPVAQSTGSLALLPETEAQAYAMVDFQSAEDAKDVDGIRAAAAELDRFDLKIGTKILPGEKLHLTPAQRDELVTALAGYAQQLYTLLHRDNLFYSECEGIVNGIQDEQSLREWLGTHPLIMDKYRN